MRILASPARRNRAANPYNARLSEAVEGAGGDVEEFSIRGLLTNRGDVWHLHWPEHTLNRPNRRAAALSLLRLWATVLAAKATGTAMAWTVHNTGSHEVDFPWLERLLLSTMSRSVDGWFALSTTAKHEALAAFPALSRRPCWVIPHGDYRDTYPPPPAPQEARRHFGLDARHRVLLFFGQIRPYKNVSHLIGLVRQSPDADLRLIAAGSASPEQERELVALAGADPRIQLHLGFVPDEDVTTYFAAADLTVLPFQRVLNSGSVLLSLSLDAPVLVPATGALMDLARDPGPPWVSTYSGELDLLDMERALDAAKDASGSRAPLDTYAWSSIGERTLAAYRHLHELRPGNAIQAVLAARTRP